MVFQKGNTYGIKKGQVSHPHGFRTINGRKFGKRFGSKGGKARWASMTQEEKEIFYAKKEYFVKRNRQVKDRLSRNSTFVQPGANSSCSNGQLDEIEEFFGDIFY